MSEKLHYFTVEEAETHLDLMTEIFGHTRQLKEKIEEKLEDWRQRRESLAPGDEAILRGQIDFLTVQMESQLKDIIDLGALPKDLDMGLVDFPAQIDGQEVYLCWKVGEKKILFWHGLTDGYRNRQPIRQETTEM